jgi:hypothetical protein
MGLIRNEHGVWCVRRKVPKALEAGTATVTGTSKARVSWLKRSLRTKDKQQAKVRSTSVIAEFDRILARAAASLLEHPLRTELSDTEIKQIADYFYAHELGADEELREEGIGSDELYGSVRKQLTDAGVAFSTSSQIEERANGSGLSDRMMSKVQESIDIVLPGLRTALARGNINFIRYELDALLEVFAIIFLHGDLLRTSAPAQTGLISLAVQALPSSSSSACPRYASMAASSPSAIGNRSGVSTTSCFLSPGESKGAPGGANN